MFGQHMGITVAQRHQLATGIELVKKETLSEIAIAHTGPAIEKNMTNA